MSATVAGISDADWGLGAGATAAGTIAGRLLRDFMQAAIAFSNSRRGAFKPDPHMYSRRNLSLSVLDTSLAGNSL